MLAHEKAVPYYIKNNSIQDAVSDAQQYNGLNDSWIALGCRLGIGKLYALIH